MNSDISALFLSLQIAFFATLLVIPVGLAISWVIVRKKNKGTIIIESVAMLPLALPPVLVGFILMWVIGGNSWIGKVSEAIFGTGIAFTWVAGTIASATVALPLTVRSFAVALSGVNRQYEEVAKGLGAGSLRIFFTITLPLARKGFMAGVLLSFIRAFSEFGATIIVAGNIPGRTQTLPTAIFTRISQGDDGSVWRLALMSILIAILTLLAHNHLWNLNRQNQRRTEDS